MSFADFPEQRQTVELLQRSLDRDRISHAYLFTGPDLSLLERLAQALAQVLNCEKTAEPGGAGVDSCARCHSCDQIQRFVHPDVQWLRPESKSRVITIDQIRALMQTINLKPTAGRYKVGVIVAADRLNPQAANAFLKTLEEPPARSVFILISNNPQQVLETVLSRCLRVTVAGEQLAHVGAEERKWLEVFAAKAAQNVKGTIGKYQLLGLFLDKLAAAKGAIEKELEARSPLQAHDEVEGRLKERWEDELVAGIEAEYRRYRQELLALLQYWFRDVWLKTLDISNDLLHFPELASLSEALAARLGQEAAQQNLKVLEQTHQLLSTNVQEALALEVGFLKLNI